MAWLPDGEKKLYDMFVRFDRIHERDGKTDRRTDTQIPHDDIHVGRACVASCGKNTQIFSLKRSKVRGFV